MRSPAAGKASLHDGHKPLSAVGERPQAFREISYGALWLRISHFSALNLRGPICAMGLVILFCGLL